MLSSLMSCFLFMREPCVKGAVVLVYSVELCYTDFTRGGLLLLSPSYLLCWTPIGFSGNKRSSRPRLTAKEAAFSQL